MTNTQAVATTQTRAVAKPTTLKDILATPAYSDRIKQILGERAPQFCASLIQIGNSPGLRDVEPNSLIAGAMQAAALDLPIEKEFGFAHLVPYKKNGVKMAQFQMGYKGFIQLGMRSGQFKKMGAHAVNAEVYKGRDEVGDPIFDWEQLDETKPVVGYAFAFQLVTGFIKSVYWTKEKMEKHAKKYSQAYRMGYETPWKTNFDDMGLKTVVRNGLGKWGIMSVQIQKALTVDQTIQATIDAAPEYVDAATEISAPKQPKAIDVGSESVTEPVVEETGGEEDDIPMGDDPPALEPTPEPEPVKKPAKKKVAVVNPTPTEDKPEVVSGIDPAKDPIAYLDSKLKECLVPEEKFSAWAANLRSLSPCATLLEVEEVSPSSIKDFAVNWAKYEKFIPQMLEA